MNPIYWLCSTFALVSTKTLCSLKVEGKENLIGPGEGGTIVACNHQSYLDPPLIAGIYEGELHFLARSTLFKGLFGKIIAYINAMPINQNGADLASLKAIIKKVKEGKRVLIFPEGTRTEDGSLGKGAAGVGMIAAKSKAIVQPVKIEGAYEVLPRDSKMPRVHPITVKIGKPIDFSHLGKIRTKEEYQEIADTIMEKIAEL